MNITFTVYCIEIPKRKNSGDFEHKRLLRYLFTYISPKQVSVLKRVNAS